MRDGLNGTLSASVRAGHRRALLRAGAMGLAADALAISRAGASSPE